MPLRLSFVCECDGFDFCEEQHQKPEKEGEREEKEGNTRRRRTTRRGEIEKRERGWLGQHTMLSR